MHKTIVALRADPETDAVAVRPRQIRFHLGAGIDRLHAKVEMRV